MAECKECEALKAEIVRLKEEIIERNIEIWKINTELFKMQREKNEILSRLGKNVKRIVFLKSNVKEDE
jgi:hypothetical protein